jgi:hypothetical protein
MGSCIVKRSEKWLAGTPLGRIIMSSALAVASQNITLSLMSFAQTTNNPLLQREIGYITITGLKTSKNSP